MLPSIASYRSRTMQLGRQCLLQLSLTYRSTAPSRLDLTVQTSSFAASWKIGEIPLACQALGAGFAGSFRELPQIRGIIDVQRDARKRRTTHGFWVARAAARCGLKLSFPKRRGNSPAGRRKAALVPRPSAAGTSTEPSAARLREFSQARWPESRECPPESPACCRPRDTHKTASPFRWRRSRCDWRCRELSGIRSRRASSTANGSLVTRLTSVGLLHVCSASSTSKSMA